MAKQKSSADNRAAAVVKKPPVATTPVKKPSVAPELVAAGKSVRKEVPRSQLGAWVAPEGRRDAVAILEDQAQGRLQDLVPLRYARMAASAFTFYRGAAALMADDLGTQGSTGLARLP